MFSVVGVVKRSCRVVQYTCRESTITKGENEIAIMSARRLLYVDLTVTLSFAYDKHNHGH